MQVGAVYATLSAKIDQWQNKFKQASQGVADFSKQVGKSFDNASVSTDRYEKKMKDLSTRKDIVADKMLNLTKLGKVNSTQFDSLSNTYRNLGNRMEQATSKQQSFSLGNFTLQGGLGALANRLSLSNKSFDLFGGKISMSGQAISNFGGMIGGAFTGAIGGAISIIQSLGSAALNVAKGGILALGAGLIGLAGYGLSLGSKLQGYNIAFTTILGSGEKAKALMMDLTQFAKTTPFNRIETIGFAQQLLGSGLAQGDIVKTMSMLGNVASGTNSDLGLLITNYSQIRAQQQAYTVDIKEFANKGIPIWDKLSKKLNIPLAALRKQLDDGDIRISFEDINSILRDMTSQGGEFFDLMQKKSLTFEGAMSNIQDSLQSVVLKFLGVDDTGSIVQGGFFDMAQTKALEFQNWLNMNSEIIGGWGARVFTALGQGISLAWTSIIQPALTSFTNWFNAGGKEAIFNFLSTAWAQLQSAFLYIKNEVLPQVIDKIKEFGNYLKSEQFKKDVDTARGIIMGVGEALKFIFDRASAAIGAIRGVNEGLKSMTAGNIGLKDLTQAVMNPSSIGNKLGKGLRSMIPGRAGGGSVNAGQMYEVGENNQAEMLKMNGKQFMIPGNKGQVLNRSQMTTKSQNNTFNVYGGDTQKVVNQVIQILNRQNNLSNSGIGNYS